VPVSAAAIPAPPGSHAVTDPGELAQFFSDDVRLHIYALADLAEPYWSASTWWRRGDAVVGLVGLPGETRQVVYAVSSRAPAETLVLLSELVDHLPGGTLLTGPLGLGAALGSARPVAWHRTYQRFWLPPGAVLPEAAPGLRSLGERDLDRIEALYRVEPAAAFFVPSMLAAGTFVGVESGRELVAIAGTHVVVDSFGVDAAAIGAVFTHPDHRGRRLGHQVTVGVCHRLRDRGAAIGLNCSEANAPARRIYLQLGFEPLLRYEEAQLASA
jgi:GNAT superfamily N-acetyltransferase